MITSSSPINRRSLIDATEKPLQRSSSPSTAEHNLIQDEWPILKPSKAASADMDCGNSTVSYESTAELHANEVPRPGKKELCPVFEMATDKNVQKLYPELDHMEAKGHISHTDANLHQNSTPPIFLSGQLDESPDWLESPSLNRGFANSTKRSSLGPVRQTKTSALRAKLAFEAPQFRNRQPSAALSSRTPSATSSSRPSSIGSSYSTPSLSRLGPTRTSRPTVSARGTPYGPANPSHVRLVDIKASKVSNDEPRGPARPKSVESTNSVSSSDTFAARHARKAHRRKSSIPLPSRLVRNLPKHACEGRYPLKALDEGDKRKRSAEQAGSEDADVESDLERTRMGIEDLDIRTKYSLKDHSTEVCSSADGNEETPMEPIQQPVHHDADSGMSSLENEDSDQGSIHSFGDFTTEGYRVKYLPTLAGCLGPRLRISKDADKIIMGTDSSLDTTSHRRTSGRRNSAPDLRRSLIIKEAFKKSKDGLINHLQMRRSSTAFSLGQANLDCEVEKVAELTDFESLPDHNCRDENATTNTSQNGEKCQNGPSDEAQSVSSGLKNLEDASQSKDVIEKGEYPADWPLKTEPCSTPELQGVREHAAEDDEPWVSPLDKHSTRFDTVFPPAESESTALRDIEKFDSSSRKTCESYPPRLSSRSAVHDMMQQSNKDITGLRQTSMRQPETIPNHFASPKTPDDCRGKTRSFKDPLAMAESFRKTGSELRPKGAKDSYPTKPVSTTSSSKKVLSNFRGLFHKRSSEAPAIFSNQKTDKPARRNGPIQSVGRKSSPINYVISPPIPSAPNNTPITYNMTMRPNFMSPATRSPNMLSLTGSDGHPRPSDALDRATTLAHKILDLASAETSITKQGSLLKLGHSLASAINAAKETEQALERAKMATLRVEMSVIETQKSIRSILPEVEMAIKMI